MKSVDLDHSEMLSVVVESLASTQPCMRKGSDCSIENNWKVSHSVKQPNKISLTAEIWKPLSKYIKEKGLLNYHKTLRLAICLGIQATALTEFGYGLAYVDSNDIMVIDDDWYLLTNLSNAVPLDQGSLLRIIKPLPPSEFLAPELKSITSLPADVDQSCAFYSIALLCLHVLGITQEEEDMKRLFPSPLFFLLERCLVEKPEDRVFLLV